MPNPPSFADWVRRRRKVLDLTQAALAERVGCALVTIRKIEQELRRPSRQMAELLMEQLAIPASQRDEFLRLARNEYVERMQSAPVATKLPAFLRSPRQATKADLFVAREAELAVLDAHLAAVQQGQGRIAFVVGEAGSGKTALIQEFSRRAQRNCPDLIAVSGRCTGYHGMGDPYLPIREILTLLTGDVESQWGAGLLTREQARHLWRLWPVGTQAMVNHGPGLIDTFVPIQPLIERAANYLLHLPAWLEKLQDLAANQSRNANGAPAQQSRIFAEVTAVLMALAAQQPLLLVLEDIHWADPSSLSLLFHLSQHVGKSPIFLLGTYRPEDVAVGRTDGEQHPLAPLLAEFKRTFGNILVSLDQTEDGADRRWLDALLDAAPNRFGEVFRQALFQQTEGHPLFAVELLRDMKARGEVGKDGAGHWVESGTLAWSTLPARVEGVIERRINRLDAEQRAILSVACVEEEIFTAQIIAHVQGVEERPLLRLLSQELEKRHGLVQGGPKLRIGGRVISRYRFSHALFKHYLYNELGVDERRLLHGEIGKALESLHAERIGEMAAILAYHFSEAEIWDRSMHYLRVAGDGARHLHASQEALSFYTQALAAGRLMTPAPAASDLLPIYEGRALVYLLLTRYDDAIADFMQMRQWAQASANLHKEGESLSHLAYVHWLTFSGAQTPLVEQFAQEALALAQQTGDGRILAQSLIRLGSVDQVRGNMPEADRKFGHALQISRREGYTDSLAHALVYLCMQNYLKAEYGRSAHFGQEGVSLFRDLHDGFNELHALAFLCQALWGAGDYAQAFALLRTGMGQAQERENLFIKGRLLNTLAWYHRDFANSARAIEFNQESVELGRSIQNANVEISALVNLGLDYLVLDQPSQALSYLEPTLERVQQRAFGAHKWRWQMKLLLGLAEVYYATGRYEQALRYLRAGLAQAHATFSLKYVVIGRTLLGKLMLTLGQREAGGKELQWAFSHAKQMDSPSLVYGLVPDLGHWYEGEGRMQDAAQVYQIGRDSVGLMATVEDDLLRAALLESVPVQAIRAGLVRTQ